MGLFYKRPTANDANILGAIGTVVGVLAMFLNVGGVIGDFAALAMSVVSGAMGLSFLVVWWTNIKGMEKSHGFLVWIGGITALALVVGVLVGAVWLLKLAFVR